MKKIIFSSLVVCASFAFMFSTNFSTDSLHNTLEGVLYDTAIAAHEDDEMGVMEICNIQNDGLLVTGTYCSQGFWDCKPKDCGSDS